MLYADLLKVSEIDPMTLPSLIMSRNQQLPELAGVYFVIDWQDTVIYVGQSHNLRQRWSSHKVSFEIDNDDARVAWLQMRNPDYRVTLESLFIKRFKPRFNIKPGASDREANRKKLLKQIALYTERAKREAARRTSRNCYWPSMLARAQRLLQIHDERRDIEHALDMTIHFIEELQPDYAYLCIKEACRRYRAFGRPEFNEEETL
jgi:GIY-YIG catalytic domain-containing protein